MNVFKKIKNKKSDCSKKDTSSNMYVVKRRFMLYKHLYKEGEIILLSPECIEKMESYMDTRYCLTPIEEVSL